MDRMLGAEATHQPQRPHTQRKQSRQEWQRQHQWEQRWRHNLLGAGIRAALLFSVFAALLDSVEGPPGHEVQPAAVYTAMTSPLICALILNERLDLRPKLQVRRPPMQQLEHMAWLRYFARANKRVAVSAAAGNLQRRRLPQVGGRLRRVERDQRADQ